MEINGNQKRLGYQHSLKKLPLFNSLKTFTEVWIEICIQHL